VVLDQDIAAIFSSAVEVNEALRALAGVSAEAARGARLFRET